MSFLGSLNISASGLTAQRYRMDVISQNIANADTTRTEAGGPYRRKTVVFESRDNNQQFAQILNAQTGDIGEAGVQVSQLTEDSSDFKRTYDPSHPDADAAGYVNLPNVDMSKEMVDMMSATRSYEANITVLNAVKMMASRALDIGK